jgi:DNA polymerase I-like protein with 3'-5' exonuclease and polymerase domains
MRVVLDVENTVIKRDGKLHLDPFESVNNLVMVGIQVEDEEPRHYTFDHKEYDCTYEYRKRDCDEVQDILDRTTLLIAHNAPHDLLWLWETGFKYDGPVFDTMLCEYVLQRGQKEPVSLEACAIRRDLPFKKQDTLKEYMRQGMAINEIPYEELKEYLYGDLRTTWSLFYEQSADLRDDDNRLLNPIVELTMETCVLLARIYQTGFNVDTDALEQVRHEFETEKLSLINDLNASVLSLMGDTPINLNSPEQLSWVIYSRKPINKTDWANGADPYMSPEAFKRFINASSVPIRRTKAVKCTDCSGKGTFFKKKKDGADFKKPTKCPTCIGRGYVLNELPKLAGLKFSAPSAKWHSANGFSTSKDKLEYLSRVSANKGMEEASSFLSKLIRLSALDTYLSSFVDGIRIFTKPDGRLHVRLTQHMTSTGRFSGRDPNMQNMPRGGTFPVKRVFISRFARGKIMEADFAQLEFRVAAFLSQDEVAMKEVAEGFDVHSYTAKIITEAGQPTGRQEAKAHTFAPLYGATGYGRTPAEAAYYEHFTQKYKGIARWHRDLAKEVLTYKKITTPSGRQFSFPDVKRRKNGSVTNFTAIKNYPVQSFATADIVPTVLLEINKRMSGMQSCIVNSVHDSIVIDIHPDEEQQVLDVIGSVNGDLKEIIDNKFNIDFNVPLLLEAKIGVNWLEQEEVST